MKYSYRKEKLSKANKEKLVVVNKIIREYQDAGYVLTLRQLYYQLVSRDIIPNRQNEYSKLSTLLKEGRMSGIVDWNAIEDRLRVPKKPSSWNSPKQILDTVVRQYQLPRMDGQENYVEVWVEKDALSGVLSRVTNKYHIPILVNRGYSSVTAVHDSFQRFQEEGIVKNRPVRVLYLGDYDPSGLDMIRDIRDRIMEFVEGYQGGDFVDYFDFQVMPIALTYEQIRQFNPPPNPAKTTDPRAKEFIEKYGATSWEVDALRPEVLHSTLENEILNLIDVHIYREVLVKEKKDIEKLKSLKNYL